MIKPVLVGVVGVAAFSMAGLAFASVPKVNPAATAAPIPTFGVPKVQRAQFGSADRPVSGPMRVLYMGTSVTIGYYASDSAHKWTSLVTDALRKGGPVEEVKAIRRPQKHRAPTMLATYDPAAVPKDLDLVVIELVTNDVNRTNITDYQDNLINLLDTIQAGSPGVNVLCLGAWQSRPGQYDIAVRDSCQARGAWFNEIASLKARLDDWTCRQADRIWCERRVPPQ